MIDQPHDSNTSMKGYTDDIIGAYVVMFGRGWGSRWRKP